MDPLFPAVPDFGALTADEIAAWIAENGAAIEAVASDPLTYVTRDRTSASLLEQLEAAVEAQQTARAALTAATAEAEPVAEEPTAEAEEVTEAEEVEENEEVGEEFAAEVAQLAAQAREPEEPEIVEEVEEPSTEVVVAAAPTSVEIAPTPTRLVRPARSTRARPQAQPQNDRLSFTAAAAGLGHDLGQELDLRDVAAAMIKKREQFGIVPDGTHQEKHLIARVSWKDRYPEDRRLSGSPADAEKVDAVIDQKMIRAEFERRRRTQLTAAAISVDPSPAMCAPVTPYYGLEDVSTGARPVRAALAAFGADRGGLRYARPATIAAITTAVGDVTAAEDAAGGTDAMKACQEIDCPDWEEVDTTAIYRCLQFRNRIARTYPELVAHWTGLTMSAQARYAESLLLTGIDNYSTEVTAGDLGLGASANLVNHYLTAAVGMRSRHRMSPDTVLRALLPWWATELFVSDVIRTQFERFDTDAAKLVALFRQHNIEPAFYLDGAAGRGQVFGTQADGTLLPFPDTVVGYLFTEGAFLFLDGGTLEIGVVRDSILNAINKYQLFSETFEEVAFTGVESLTIISSVCDSGTVSLPASVTCPVDYTPAS